MTSRFVLRSNNCSDNISVLVNCEGLRGGKKGEKEEEHEGKVEGVEHEEE